MLLRSFINDMLQTITKREQEMRARGSSRKKMEQEPSYLTSHQISNHGRRKIIQQR